MSDVTFDSPLLSHYQSLLLNISIYVDENGLCYSKKNGTDVQIPTVIENRRLTLPTQQLLSNPDFDKTIVFHPFSESIVRGESEMITWMKDRMDIRLNTMIGIMVMDFAAMAASGDLQKKLTTDQLNTVMQFGDADDKTLENVSTLCEALVRGKGQWIHLYLRHSGKHGDKQAKRFCKVTFPVYKELLEETAKVSGVTLRVKDRKFLKAVLEYIFDKIGTEDAYSYGSNSEIAPYYHALIHGYAKVGVPMSSRIYLFRKHMEKIANTRIHTDGWLDTFDEAAAASKFVPSMPFNVGIGGQGTGNENFTAAQNVKAGATIVPEAETPEVKVNNQLQQIQNNGSGLHALISGHGHQASAPTSNLNNLLNGGNASGNSVFGSTSPLNGIPRVSNNQPATTSVFGNTGVQQNAFGNTNSVFGNQGSVFGNQGTSNPNSPLAGLPRR